MGDECRGRDVGGFTPLLKLCRYDVGKNRGFSVEVVDRVLSVVLIKIVSGYRWSVPPMFFALRIDWFHG